MTPYAIDTLPVAAGRIGLCCCPGYRLSGHALRPALDSFESDLDVIVGFGASRLVTLMEPDELAFIGIEPARLAREARARGLDWLHLPIRNLSVPGAAWEADWRTSGALLRRALAEGGRFALHCYAGLGRTGTVAARILIEHGTRPRDAIAQVRTVRPGSIETLQQESYLLRGRWA